MIDRFEIACQPGLGRPVEHDRFASPFTGDGTEDTERWCRCAAAQQSFARRLTKKNRAGEVDVEEPLQLQRVGFELGLRHEQRRGDDHEVKAAKPATRLVESLAV